MILTKRIVERILLRPVQRRAFAEQRKIPDDLLTVQTQEDPAFSEMVRYFFYKARIVVEDKLVESLRKHYYLSLTERETKVRNIMTYLEKPDCVIEYKSAFIRDAGGSEMLSAYKVQHKGHRLPFMGGLRYGQNVTRDQMLALATIITYKCACAGVSHGGSTTGIRIDPKKYTTYELERITRSLTHQLVSSGVIGPSIDILAPDDGTGEREMTWISDSYRKAFGNIRNVGSNAVVTGRTKTQGGHFQDLNPTAFGIFYCIKAVVNRPEIMAELQLKPGLEGKTFIVLGYGRLAAETAILLTEAGAKCVGVQGLGDVGLTNSERGFHSQRLYLHKLTRGSLRDYEAGQLYKGELLISEPCDILILAAEEKSIKKTIAERLRAKIIVEAKYGVITPAADEILLQKDTVVLPDLLTGMGRVIVSHIELLHELEGQTFKSRFMGDHYIHFMRSVQDSLNRQHDINIGELFITPTAELMLKLANASEESIILSCLEGEVQSRTDEVVDTASEFKLGKNLRTASYIKAIEKIFEDINDVIFTW